MVEVGSCVIGSMENTDALIHLTMLSEPDGKLMVLVIADTSTLMIYEGSTLKWSAQLPFAPVAVARVQLEVSPSWAESSQREFRLSRNRAALFAFHGYVWGQSSWLAMFTAPAGRDRSLVSRWSTGSLLLRFGAEFIRRAAASSTGLRLHRSGTGVGGTASSLEEEQGYR